MLNLKRHYRPLCAAVAVALLALSLRHLVDGIASTTGSGRTESLLTAIGIDLAMVAVEIAILAGVRTKWTEGILVSVALLSAGFNVLGFLAHAQGPLGIGLAVALGLLVPATVLGLVDTINRPPRILHRTKARRVRVVRTKPPLRAVG